MVAGKLKMQVVTLKRYYKKCPKCGLVKTVDSFYKHNRYGIRSWCKVCELDSAKSNKNKIRRHNNYIKNKSKEIKANKEWVQKNRIKRNEYMRNYMRLKYLRERKINYEHTHINNDIVWA